MYLNWGAPSVEEPSDGGLVSQMRSEGLVHHIVIGLIDLRCRSGSRAKHGSTDDVHEKVFRVLTRFQTLTHD